MVGKAHELEEVRDRSHDPGCRPLSCRLGAVCAGMLPLEWLPGRPTAGAAWHARRSGGGASLRSPPHCRHGRSTAGMWPSRLWWRQWT